MAHRAGPPFSANVDALKQRTAFIVTSDDGLADANKAFAADLRQAGDTHVTSVHLPTNHAYSDQRVELSQAVLEWLAALPRISPTRSSNQARWRGCGNGP